MRRREAAYAGVDQAVSSLGNFVLLVLVARVVTVQQFGRFTLVLIIYALILGACQALVSEVVLFRFPRMSPNERTGSGALALSMLIGLASGCVLALASQASDAAAPALILAVGLPFLLLQDAERHIWLSTSRARSALLNDSAWTLIVIIAIPAYSHGHRLTAGWGVFIWMAGGALCALVGLVQLRELPSPANAAAHYRLARPYLGPLVGEFILLNAAMNIVLILVSVVLGLSATAGIRAATAIYSPLSTLFSALRLVVVPWLSEAAHKGLVTLRPIVLTSSIVGAVSIAYWMLIVILPPRFGQNLFGASWSAAAGLAVPAGLQRILTAFTIGPGLGLRAMEAIREGFLVRLLTSFATLCLGVLGTTLGAAGVLWGFNLASLVSSGAAWFAIRVVLTRQPATKTVGT